MILGYSSWSGGQLERELTESSWLTMPSDHDILFNSDPLEKASQAAKLMGFDLKNLIENQISSQYLQALNSITKKEILEEIWDILQPTEEDVNKVEVYIGYLRKKLKPFNLDVYINTVRGFGYRWN